MRIRGGKRTFQDGGVNPQDQWLALMQSRQGAPGAGMSALMNPNMQGALAAQVGNQGINPSAAPVGTSAPPLNTWQGMQSAPASPAAGARPAAPPGGFTAAAPGAAMGGIGAMNPAAMQQAMMARRGAVGGPLAGGAPGGPVRPPVTGAGAMPGNGALPGGGMFAGAGAPPAGMPPAPPAGITPLQNPGMAGPGGAGAMMQAAPQLTSANSGWVAPNAPAGFRNPQATPAQFEQAAQAKAQLLQANPGLAGAGMGFAKGGHVDSSGAGIDEDRQLGDKSAKPMAKAKGGKVRTFNSASAPAENLPTHPGKEKLAKGGVLKRKPLSKAPKQPVPTPPSYDDNPPAYGGQLPPMTAGMAKGGKAGGKWIGSAIKKPGALHKQLGVPQGEKIPAGKLAKAAEAGGKLGKRARLAETLKGLKKNKGGACDKMAAGGAAKVRKGFPNVLPAPKRYREGGRIRGTGIATKGTRFSGIY